MVVVQTGFSQGFVNLDFESANISQRSGNVIQAADAFPGWSVNAPFVYYDSISLSGGSISIFNPTSSYPVPPIQGNYYAYLASVNVPGYDIPISLGQSGLVPSSTQSIQFWGNISGMQITFSGQPLFFNILGTTANYNIYGADISTYAGQTGQLLFTLPPLSGNASLDNIQFSSSSVPEPSALALGGLGILLFGFRSWRNYLS